MFGPKKQPVKEGVSFPFLESKDGKLELRFDSFRVEVAEDSVSCVFICDGLEIAKQTYARPDGYINYNITFPEATGKVTLANFK